MIVDSTQFVYDDTSKVCTLLMESCALPQLLNKVDSLGVSFRRPL